MPITSVNETEIEAISATPHIKIGLFVMKGNSPQDYPRFGHSVWQFSDGAFLADIFSSFQRHWHKLTWMNVLGAIAIVFSMLGFAGAHRFFKTKSRKTRVIACLTLGILAIPSILFAIYYLHVLPEKVWFYTFRSWSGTELLAGFLGAACGVLATLLPRFLLMIPLGFTMVMASVPYLKMIMSPLDLGGLKEQWEGDACLQSTASTCGPASSASILRFLDYPASEREIAIACYSSSSGTEAWYLARYLRSRGLAVEFNFRSNFTPSIALPAVVGVSVGGYGHFIAVLEIRDGLVTFVDPLSGKHEMALEKFMQAYRFTGFYMTVLECRL